MNICSMWPRDIRRPERSLGRGARRPKHAGTSGTRNEDGFTLIEMLIVVAIIGLLAAFVGPKVLSKFSESQVKVAAIQIESFKSTLDLFYLDLGRYPSNSEGLAALVQRPGGITGWNGPYLAKTYVPDDPWGHPYKYRSPGENGRTYDIWSLGSSGKEGGTGTAVAIRSWERR